MIKFVWSGGGWVNCERLAFHKAYEAARELRPNFQVKYALLLSHRQAKHAIRLFTNLLPKKKLAD